MRYAPEESFTSAEVGLALQQGCLSSLDQKMVEFFRRTCLMAKFGLLCLDGGEYRGTPGATVASSSCCSRT